MVSPGVSTTEKIAGISQLALQLAAGQSGRAAPQWDFTG
jgi:hypothetical protein